MTTTRTVELPAVHRYDYPGADAEVVTYHHGRATVSRSRDGDPVSRDFDTVTCDHRHQTVAAAEACAAELGAATARERNERDQARYASTPCDVRAYPSPSATHRGGIWIKACFGHGEADTRARFTDADAMRLDWACPWAGIAPPAADPPQAPAGDVAGGHEAEPPADHGEPPGMIP